MTHQTTTREARRATFALILLLALLALTTITNTLNAAPTFTDVTIAAGVDYIQWQELAPPPSTRPMTGGAAVADVDGDGYPDLYVTRLDGPDILFRNNQAGGFDDITIAAGLSANLPTNGPVFADIDNDGDQDLYITSVDTNQHYLYINDGSGNFTEEALARGAAIDTGQTHSGFSTAFGDYDGDGYLDLYVTEWGNTAVNPPDELISHARLLRNLGAANPGHFEDKTLESGVYLDDSQAIMPAGTIDGVFAFTPTFADFNRDGLPDLAIAADFNTSRLYWNNGDGTFTKAPGPTDPSPSGIGTDENGMGSAIADYNGDGLLDWFVTSIYDPCTTPCDVDKTGNRLYQNNGDQTFTDVTDAAGVREGGWGWGATFLDYDNDGDLDLTMTNGFDAFPFDTDPVKLWQNDGSGSFTEVAAAEGLTDTGSGKGMLTFDYDLDGDLDIFIVNNSGHPKLYRNDSDSTNGYLRIDLEGLTSNKKGIGAFITVTPVEGGPSQTRYITGGNNYLSQNELTAHFGLGPGAGTVDQLTIRWPSGLLLEYTNLTSNMLHTIFEPIPGDGNLSGEVEAADYTIWANSFGMVDPWFTDGDYNGDGSTDASDYTIWANNYGQMVAAPSGAPAAVPEPSTFLLAIVGIIGLCAYHRRRRR